MDRSGFQARSHGGSASDSARNGARPDRAADSASTADTPKKEEKPGILHRLLKVFK